MQFTNQISTAISDKDLEDILAKIDQIDHKLNNLVALTDEQRKAIPTSGTDTSSFVVDVLETAENNLELIPEKVDIEEVRKDVELIAAINKIYGPLNKLLKKLEDSALIASSEAYFPALAIFNAYKNAKRKNINTLSNFNNYPKASKKREKEIV